MVCVCVLVCVERPQTTKNKEESKIVNEYRTPPPKNVERDIYEYVDCKNKDTFFNY